MIETKFQRGGFTLKVNEETDQYGEPDCLGKFTNDWAKGALDHHRKSRFGARDELRWFIPDYTVEEHRADLQRLGHSKQVAEEMARESAEKDYERADGFAHDWHYNTIIVTAYRCGIELGDANLGQVESDADDVYLQEVVDELADDAIVEANKNLDDLLSTVSPLTHLAKCAE